MRAPFTIAVPSASHWFACAHFVVTKARALGIKTIRVELDNGYTLAIIPL
jgi:hypothetical protein